MCAFWVLLYNQAVWQNDEKQRYTHFVGKLGGQVNFHLFNRPGESASAVLDVDLNCGHGEQRNAIKWANQAVL